MLDTLRALAQAYPQVDLNEPLNYLAKREAMLRYPQFIAAGWPIGSGVAESANKLVVQARLKGPGMHWQREQVNPMLALRNVVFNERWDENWPEIVRGLRLKRQILPAVEPEQPQPSPNLILEYFKEMQRHHRA